MATYKIENSLNPGNSFMLTIATDGEVTSTTSTYAGGFFYSNSASRNAAIALINGCPKNADKFIGQVPNGHP